MRRPASCSQPKRRSRPGILVPDPGVVLLAPLDAFVWDRDLLRSLFGFDYVWEVYVPQAKRRWGYYVLPLLFGDRLVGRIEPRIDRAAGTVRILGAWWEPGFRPRHEEGFVPALRAALAAYLRFVGASRLEWAAHLAARATARRDPAAGDLTATSAAGCAAGAR